MVVLVAALPALAAVPAATTGEASVQWVRAQLNANVDPADLETACEFEWTDDANWQLNGTYDQGPVACESGVGAPLPAGAGPQDVWAQATGLQPGTTYHFRVIATNADGTVHGEDRTFTTNASSAPVVSSDWADSITGAGATVHGTVNPADSDASCRVVYADDATFQANPGTYDQGPVACAEGTLQENSGSHDVSAQLTGLSQGTTYHFRFEATNSTGTGEGNDSTFTTAIAPAIGSQRTDLLTTTSARLGGSLDPLGWETSWQWEYSTDPGLAGSTLYPADPVSAGAGSGDTPLPVRTIAGLTADTTYFYRLVATSLGGTTEGPIQSFRTAPAAAPNADDVTMTSATLHGTANPQGHSATWRFAYGIGSLDRSTPSTDVGASDSADHPVSLPVTDLKPGSTYNFRVVVTLDDGTVVEGASGSFQTDPGPVATAGSPSAIGTNSVTLHGTADTRGLDGSYQFVVQGTDNPFSSATPSQPTSGGPVSATLSGLPSGGSFTVRLVVSAGGATSASEPVAFATQSPPPFIPRERPQGGASPYGCDQPRLQPAGTARPGLALTLKGTDLGTGGQVRFGTRLIEADSWSPTSVTFTVPRQAAGTIPVQADCGKRSNAIPVRFPVSRFTIGKGSVKRGARVGVLRLTLPGPGALTAKGKYVRKTRVTVSKAGAKRVKLRLNAAGRKALRKRHGRPLHVGVKLTFTPTGGSAHTKTKAPALTFRRR